MSEKHERLSDKYWNWVYERIKAEKEKHERLGDKWMKIAASKIHRQAEEHFLNELIDERHVSKLEGYNEAMNNTKKILVRCEQQQKEISQLKAEIEEMKRRDELNQEQVPDYMEACIQTAREEERQAMITKIEEWYNHSGELTRTDWEELREGLKNQAKKGG